MERSTLRDVAERSGLSITTVSHVVNDVPGKRIPDATRERVRVAVAELHYTPNRLARACACNGRTRWDSSTTGSPPRRTPAGRSSVPRTPRPSTDHCC